MQHHQSISGFEMTLHSPRCRLLAVAAAVFPMLAWAQPAAPGEPAASLADSLFGGRTELTIGAGAGYAARYPGADSRELTPAPVLAVSRGILFADTLRGIGLQYQSDAGFYVSQALFYDLGRLDKNSAWRPGGKRLAGMGEVPGSATAHTVIAQQLVPWLLVSAETEMALRDTARRNRYRLGVEFTPLKTASDSVTVDIDAWWDDARYNRAYFGVTPQQAARTSFAVFTPGAGLSTQVPSLSWEHHLDSHWTSTIGLTASHYAGKLSRSPVVAQRTSAGTSAVVAYVF